MIAGKRWGQTRLVASNKALELHAVKIKKGRSCSKHRHLTKYNGFYVVSGLLAVDVWKAGGVVDRTLLGPGDYMEVQPPEWHQFTAMVDVEALEVYWSQFDSDDIEREAQ